MIPIIMTLGKTAGTVVLTLLTQLLTGKSFKQLLLWPLTWFSKKTKTEADDKVVEQIKHDWQLDDANKPNSDTKE